MEIIDIELEENHDGTVETGDNNLIEFDGL